MLFIIKLFLLIVLLILDYFVWFLNGFFVNIFFKSDKLLFFENCICFLCFDMFNCKKKRSENIFNERYKVFCKKFCNKFLSLGKIYIFIIIYNNKENISYKFVFMGICCFICL